MKNKKGTIIHIINWCLLFSLPAMLLTVKVRTTKVKSLSDTKKLSTNLFSTVDMSKTTEATPILEEDTDDSTTQEKEKEVTVENTKTQQTIEKEVEEEKKEEQVTETTSKEETITPVVNNSLATYTGKMSFYYANCTGCSGITSTGVDVSDGKLYYQDSQYGSVRIVAAGTEIKKWSIIRINNSSLGNNVLAIVLDRGGDIGNGRKFLIDMLTNTSEGRGGVNNNITVEVLRNGK